MKAIAMIVLVANATFLTSVQESEIRMVEERLLAPCCYTQSIAEHGSNIARQMRTEVTRMVAEGRTEEEIVSHYRTLYGDRILIVPDGMTGKILFSLPVLISWFAFAILLVVVRKMLKSGKKKLTTSLEHRVPVIDSRLRERIERELGEPF
jgi:cytochrome c-type biogenesis protein CcmH